MCLRPSSSSGSNSADAAAVEDDASSSDSKAESSPPVLTDFSNLVGALHKAVDAIRKQNGLPPMVSNAALPGPRRYDVCPDCGGKPTAEECPGCGCSVVAGGEARWSGWLPW